MTQSSPARSRFFRWIVPSVLIILASAVLLRLLAEPAEFNNSLAQVAQPTETPPSTAQPTATIIAATMGAPTVPVSTPLPTESLLPAKSTPHQTVPTSTQTPPPFNLIAEDWKNWPVIPQVSENARAIYQRGLSQGNDPYTFSILGDCQSLPETFMGIYDTEADLSQMLSLDLQETVEQFSGSFSRPGPTIKNGTTSAAVLWFAWHEGMYGCGANETPLACELRLSNPSIAIINLGTHYETRNIDYLRKVIEILIENGTLPILSTKADNRELDERLNQEMAQLALEYDIPLWNFYAAVSHLPNNGVSIKAGDEHLGVIYLIPEALEIHRFSALQALNAVWKAVR